MITIAQVSPEELKDIIRSAIQDAMKNQTAKPHGEPEHENKLIKIGEVCKLLKVSKVTGHKWKKDWAVDKKKNHGKVIWWAELGIRDKSDAPRDCRDVLAKLNDTFLELAGFVSGATRDFIMWEI